MNRNCISNNAKINSSIYETNSFLIKNQIESEDNNGVSLIEYAAFFGSIQIIKYLQLQGVELTSSLWIYAIHSQNAELIHFLEDCDVEPSVSYEECFKESIKCNHNDFANYIQNNLMDLQKVSDFNLISICRKYHNYFFFPDELEINADVFYDCCEFDYISIIDFVFLKSC